MKIISKEDIEFFKVKKHQIFDVKEEDWNNTHEIIVIQNKDYTFFTKKKYFKTIDEMRKDSINTFLNF